MSSDRTFLTNEPGKSLRDRFSVLLSDDTRYFDCLVGYFFISEFYRGRDIERYCKLKPKLFLIATKNGVNVRRDYPAIYRHLRSFGEKFQKRGAQGENWWNRRACAFYDDFDKEKIVWMELTDRARFTNCEAGIWCLNTACFMTGTPQSTFLPFLTLGPRTSILG